MVDVIPWCAYFLCYKSPGHFTSFDFGTVKYLPYIGLPFQKHARDGQKQVQLMVGRPFKHVQFERVCWQSINRWKLMGGGSQTGRRSLHSHLLYLMVKSDWQNHLNGIASCLGRQRLCTEVRRYCGASVEEDSPYLWADSCRRNYACNTPQFHTSNDTEPNPSEEGASWNWQRGTRALFLLCRFLYRITEMPRNTKVGRLRSPRFSDRPHLPYVNALVKEVTRWRVVLPLGISWKPPKKRITIPSIFIRCSSCVSRRYPV